MEPSKRNTQAVAIIFSLATALLATKVSAASAHAVSWTCRVTRGQTQVDFHLPRKTSYHYFSLRHPLRLVIDLDSSHATHRSPGRDTGCGAVKSLHWAERKNSTLRYVLVLSQDHRPQFIKSPGSQAQGLVLSVRLGKMDATPPDSSHSSSVTTNPEQAPQPLLRINRAKGRIVIAVDPGHGGSDPGTHGPHGLDEKAVTLAIARILARKIDATPGLTAFLTRDSDHYVGLRRRVLEAQKHHAALFISIHANAYPKVPRVRGGAVYALSEHGASNAEAGLLARTENAADPTIGNIHFAPHNRLVNSALTHMAQRASIANGSQLGKDVLTNLSRYEPLYERHVQYANFEVLRDPVIPSILIETAFLSNPHQARELHEDKFREKLATAIYDGIREYLKSHDLSPVQLVRNREKGNADNLRAVKALQQATPGKARPSVYRVQSDDTLSGVALSLHVTQWRLRVYNHMRSKRLLVGQVLKVPPSTFKYKVKPGDSLSVIAEKAGVSTNVLKAYNNLDGNQLKAGEMLTLPPLNRDNR